MEGTNTTEDLAKSEYTQIEQFITTNGRMVVGIPHVEQDDSVVLLMPYLVAARTPLPDCLKKYSFSPMTLFYKSSLESRSLPDPRLERAYLSRILHQHKRELSSFFCLDSDTVDQYCRRRIELESCYL